MVTKASVSIEAGTLSEFQKQLHIAKDRDEMLDSRFVYVTKKYPWSSIFRSKMKSMMTGDDLTYTISDKFDALTNSYMTARIPNIEVKRKYRGSVQICLPHNIGHNILTSSQLCYDGEPIQSSTSVWRDIFSQTLLYKDRDSYSVNIGNIDILQKWGSVIPTYDLMIPGFWFFDFSDKHSLPLFVCSGSFSINCVPRLEYSKLVRMRVRSNDGGEWKIIPYNHKYIQGGKREAKIPTPEMWGVYSILSPSEKRWFKSEDRSILISDCMEACKVEAEDGSTKDMILQSNYPAKAIFWVAENKDSSDLCGYSNYTSDTKDHRRGWTPIVSSLIKCGTTNRFGKARSEIHTSRAECYFSLIKCPSEQGYNMHSFSHDLFSDDVDTTVNLKKNVVTLTLKIGDTGPADFLQEESDESDKEEDLVPVPIEATNQSVKKPCYNLHAYLLVMKRLKFCKDGSLSIEGGVDVF